MKPTRSYDADGCPLPIQTNDEQLIPEQTVDTAQRFQPYSVEEYKMPQRYHIAVDFGLMTLDQAKAAWAEECPANGEFDPLGDSWYL